MASSNAGTIRDRPASKAPMPTQTWPVRLAACLAALLVLIVLGAGCSAPPKLTEFDEQSNEQARSAPLVIVGVADSDVRVGRRVPSRRNPNWPMQLHRVRVRIENVLKGSIGEQTISVYYFGFAGGFNGPRPLGFGSRPSRRILWLRRDGETLRMACDGWDRCTLLVDSGAHPGYRADPARPLNRALADILLTRGEGGVDDLSFARQVRSGGPDEGVEGYVIEKLAHLARTETSGVRGEACQLLWIYAQDQIGVSLRRQAQGSLQAANCNCRVKPNGDLLECR